MKMSSRLILFVILAAVVRGEDVIVASGKGLQVVNERGAHRILTYQHPTHVSGYGTVPLAVDSTKSRVFYSLPQLLHDGHMVSRLMYVNIDPEVNQYPQPDGLFPDGITVGQVRGLAYDELSGVLYWTNMLDHSIWQCNVKDACGNATLLERLPEGREPAAIAVNPCGRYLFWTDNNHTSPSINRIRMNGKKSTKIVSTGLFMPNGIAIDTSGSGRIYWTDDSMGEEFKIMSSDANGKNRRTEMRGHYQRPMDLTFSPPSAESPNGALYWTDWTSHAVWTLDLKDKRKGARVLSYRGEHWDQPMGILTKASLQRRIQC